MSAPASVGRRCPDTVRFYFSYRSPYAWLASLRLPEALAGLPVTIERRPVWEPEPDLKDRLAQHEMSWDLSQPTRAKRWYIFEDVRRHARAYGLPMVWPIDRDPQWSIPHLGLLYAREHGREAAYHDRVFQRRFLRGENVTDVATIVAVAKDVGLDADEMVDAIHDNRYQRVVLDCFRDAFDDKVCGWPFFVYGRQRFWGNDRLEWLARVIRSDYETSGKDGRDSEPDGAAIAQRLHG